MALRPTDFKSVADTNFATGARAESSRHGHAAHCFRSAVSATTKVSPRLVPRASAHAMRKRSEVMLNQLWWHETPGIQSLPIVPWKADKPSCVAPSICQTSQK